MKVKTEINEKLDDNADWEYPAFGVRTNDESYIVLFTKKGTGVILTTEYDDDVGESVTGQDMSDYRKFYGEIVLNVERSLED
jgi:hypothetical protein